MKIVEIGFIRALVEGDVNIPGYDFASKSSKITQHPSMGS